jgi:acyl-CoA thioester hydrolase
MGIVYYVRYFEYFEEARTELLRSIGLSVTEIERSGIFLPVVSCQCDYKNSAKFDDELTVVTKIKDVPRSTLKIEYTIYNSKNILLVQGHTIHSFMNKSGKAVKPPKKIIDKIKG